jgi:hypothetical protein
LAPDVTTSDVRARLPDLIVTPFEAHARPQDAAAVLVFLVASGLLLLLTWVQVGALLVARSVDRTGDIAVRLALGATPTQLASSAVREHLVLVGAAALVAWLATPLATRLLIQALPPELTMGRSVGVDWATFRFTVALGLLGALCLSVVPVQVVWRAASSPLSSTRLPGRQRTSGTRVHRVLFVSQVLLTSGLVYGSGLAIRSFGMLRAVELGYEPSAILIVKVPPPSLASSVRSEDARSYRAAHRATVRSVFERVTRLDGVVAAATSSWWPMQQRTIVPLRLRIEGDPTDQRIEVLDQVISLGYPAVLGLQFIEGREPTLEELRSPPPGITNLAVVTEAIAGRLRRFGNPVGQVLLDRRLRYKVVGVIPDIRVTKLDEDPIPLVMLYSPPEFDGPFILARTTPGDTATAAAIQTLLRDAWADRAPLSVDTIERAVDMAVAEYRGRMLILSFMSAVALVLAAAGIAGATTDFIRRRHQEFAVRIAVGADPKRLRRQVLSEICRFGCVGALLGVVAGVLVGRLMQAYLFEVTHMDVPIAILVSLGMPVTVWWASHDPSRAILSLEPGQLFRVT